ncbi:hypothetical protein NZA98_05620, partial [Escherichia coli]|nr:hypothetical protein [Escherichia coli]
MKTGDDPQRGIIGLFPARQNLDRFSQNDFGLGDEIGTVFGFARCRRRQHIQRAGARLIGQGAEPAQRPQGALHGLFIQLAGFYQAFAKAAENLFVEKDGRRTGNP